MEPPEDISHGNLYQHHQRWDAAICSVIDGRTHKCFTQITNIINLLDNNIIMSVVIYERWSGGRRSAASSISSDVLIRSRVTSKLRPNSSLVGGFFTGGGGWSSIR